MKNGHSELRDYIQLT